MSIPSRQIGWGTEENLLWQIAKQLEYLTKVIYNIGNNSPTVTVNSQSLTFPINYTSLSTRCDESNVGNIIYTNSTVNNIGEAVTLFNNNVEAKILGTYSALGEDVLVLTTTNSIKNILCPTGTLSLYVFND
jgi:hypothetical protein